MKRVQNTIFPQERALYGEEDLLLEDCRFEGEEDGESALKECKNINIKKCFFDLRYPLWHDDKVLIEDSIMTPNCRASLWYTNNVKIYNSSLNGIKALRECKDIEIKDCNIESPEFGWKSHNISCENIKLVSEYAFLLATDLKLNNLDFKGKYSFQYVENMRVKDSKFDTKDAFWHSKNVTVKNSIIKGEYLGWYSDNLTLINCHIEGTQPLCYCTNLKLINCTTSGCDLSFETSDVEATIRGKIESIKNPRSGNIYVDELGKIVNEYTKYPVNGKIYVKNRQ
ncbi:MAG: DUF3737 family protein [Bacilli bacterium]